MTLSPNNISSNKNYNNNIPPYLYNKFFYSQNKKIKNKTILKNS